MEQRGRSLFAFVAALLILIEPAVDAAVAFADCGDGPCLLPLPQSCPHYVKKSYLFSGSCCSLSDSDDGCLLTVSDGNCEYTAGEPGLSLTCETISGDSLNCFQHAHEPVENACRDWSDDSIIFNMTEFVACSAVPSFTATTLVSESNETCPESQFPLQPDTMWTPPSNPVLETVEAQDASNAPKVRLVRLMVLIAASSAAVAWILA